MPKLIVAIYITVMDFIDKIRAGLYGFMGEPIDETELEKKGFR